MNITLNRKTLIDKFLNPVSKIAERCVVSVYRDHIKTLVTNSDGNPILYVSVNTPSKLDGTNEVSLNIPDINKLNRMLNCITSDTIDLTLNSNNIEYKSVNMNFKYHLLEDGIIERSPISVDKITALTFDTKFKLDKDVAADIMKGSMFASESNKMYIYTSDGTVYIELGDKDIANTDSVKYSITDSIDGSEINKPVIIDMETFKKIYGLKEDMWVKVNTKNRVVMFGFNGSEYTLKYIVASKTT